MRSWIGGLCLVGAALFAMAPGCGVPEVVQSCDGIGCVAASGNGGNAGSDAGSTGGGFTLGDGGPGTTCPSTCAELDADCGVVTDTRCGGVIQCGSCSSGEVCGGGGKNRCGVGSVVDGGGPSCTPKTCSDLGVNCGPVFDGCSAIIDCGGCPTGESCGAAGPNLCGTGTGDGGTCATPQTCASQNVSCGQVGDGCGNVLDCGGCTAPDTCGGAGVPGQCGSFVCMPTLTCASQGITCGAAADNCGNPLSCGTCKAPKACGGDPTKPGACGCTGACSQIPDCGSSSTGTTVSGKVYDPAGNNPLYHVLVYIPNNPNDPALQTFPKGISCDQCGATAAGDPLVSTYTDVDGSFQLTNVPVGSNLKLVIQLGRWRRVFSLNVSTSCGSNPITDKTLTMPKSQAEGNIPLMAMMTGNADSLECVLRKMGIADTEFTNPAGNGRVQFYLGAGNYGQKIDSNTPAQSVLLGNDAMGNPVIDQYDMVILACQGSAYNESAADQARLRAYAAGGGRVFATHYSYTWLANNDDAASSDDWSTTAQWHVDEGDRPASVDGIIDMVKNPKANAFKAWLEAVGASTPGSGTAPVIVIRHDTDGVLGQTQQWLYRDGPNLTSKVCQAATGRSCTVDNDCKNYCSRRTTQACTVDADCGNRGPCVLTTSTCTTVGNDYTGKQIPLHFTYNTPVGAASANQCGRVLFSDFHVQDANEHNIVFPNNCDTQPMNAQEKLLEYMIFDLGSCVTPYTPVCTPKTCSDLGIQCGAAGDGCGNSLDCGSCPSGQFCGLGGPGKCGSIDCTPTTCAAQNLSCGPASDGCNSLLDCGSCPSGQTCGGGGPGKCGSNSCTPLTCNSQNLQCGQAGDGCGHVLSCGTCPAGQACVGGHCSTPNCLPQSCADQGIECGAAGDGCGNEIQCGNCPTGQTCGFSGPGKCGSVQ